MKTVNLYIRDYFKAFMYGVISAAAISLLTFIIGIFTSSFELVKALNIVRTTMLVVGALGLFLVAALLLTKKSTPLKNQELWKKHFQTVSLVHVITAICVAIILFAVLIDYIIFML